MIIYQNNEIINEVQFHEVMKLSDLDWVIAIQALKLCKLPYSAKL